MLSQLPSHQGSTTYEKSVAGIQESAAAAAAVLNSTGFVILQAMLRTGFSEVSDRAPLSGSDTVYVPLNIFFLNLEEPGFQVSRSSMDMNKQRDPGIAFQTAGPGVHSMSLLLASSSRSGFGIRFGKQPISC